jgi:hypothetical protein
MFSFIRLLELAGIPILLEALTPSQAAAIFKSNGATDDDLKSPQALKMARNRLIKGQHSDVTGGSDENTKMINAAYDVLKTLSNGFDKKTFEPEDAGFPAWQTDSRSSYNKISRQDYRDVNYFKKSMWELSGKSRKKYTIWAFDGHFFRSVITVFGSPEIYHEMAKAMEIWNSHGGNPYKTRAVFFTTCDDSTLYLIYLDGKFYDAIPFEHDSFNKNPSNDQQFVRKLPDMLDQIAEKNRLV